MQIPHAAVKEKASRVHERTIIEQQQKNSSYQLISDDDDDDDDYVHPIKVRELTHFCQMDLPILFISFSNFRSVWYTSSFLSYS